MSFQVTSRPFMRSRIIRHDVSNSAIFTGCSPITRRAESPRPMPITIRPPESTCIVAYALASTVGSRVPGFVTKWPSFIVEVRSAASVRSGIDVLPEDVRVVRPAVLEALLLGELEQLEEARVRRVGQDGDAEADRHEARKPTVPRA